MSYKSLLKRVNNKSLFSINNDFISKMKTKYNKITVSDYIIQRLLYKKIDTAFGYNGGAALPFFDSISKNGEFNVIINRHEQNSGHAAEAYGKIKKNIGVIITTSGPGFTNIITPIQDAYSDGRPLLCISSQVNSYTLDTDAFQECDAISITKSCVKDNYLVKTSDNFPNILEYMINLCENPRAGPVHIDICKDVFNQYVDLFNIFTHKTPYIEEYSSLILHINNLKKIVDCQESFHELYYKIIKSKYPVLIVGAGAINDYKEIREFSKNYQIPVVSTLHGLGVIDEYDELSLKMLGMHGTYQANMAVMNSDLIIGLGNRYDDRTVGKKDEFALNARYNYGIVHIDNSEIQIQKIIKYINPTLSIKTDTKTIINYLNTKHRILKVNINRNNWKNRVKTWEKSFNLDYDNTIYGTTFSSNYIIEILSVILKNREDYILTTGVGSHQMIVAQYFRHRYPNKLITSGSLGTMGTGLPFAIGAQIAAPDSQVILIDGDASFTMSSNELATICEYNLPIKIFIMNDRKLKMVDYWQELFYNNNKTASSFKYTPKFDKLGEAYGIKSYFCDNKYLVEDILKDALSYNGPALINFKIDESYCLPFVPSNTPLDKMITV
tara:strand:+ start:915 stop:2747 length:1833 start_codon:yes stop_codon:yes gene_type:complete